MKKKHSICLQIAIFVKIASTIGKYFIVYDTPLVQQRECFLYQWWYKFRTIAGIVQRLDLWANNIGDPSDTYNMDLKLSFFELRSFFAPPPSCCNVLRFPVCVPFSVAFCLYYYHRSITNATGNSVIFCEWLIELELAALFKAGW